MAIKLIGGTRGPKCTAPRCSAAAVGWPEYWTREPHHLCWLHMESGSQIAFIKALGAMESVSHGFFQHVDFSGERLEGITFTGCSFVEARLQDAILNNATLLNCDGRGADFRNAVLGNVSFRNDCAVKPDQDGRFPSWGRATFAFCRLKKVHIEGVDFHQANFYGVAAKGLTFTDADLHEANFSHADLGALVLKSCNGASTNFENTHLLDLEIKGALDSKSKFARADFTGAVLRFTKQYSRSRIPFRCCDFQEAHFDAMAVSEHAEYQPSVLFDACDLKGATLQRVHLIGWVFRGEKKRLGHALTLWDGVVFAGAILERCRFERLSLVAASFTAAQMSGLSSEKNPAEILFDGCLLNAAAFSRATLKNAHFKDCKGASTLFDNAFVSEITWDESCEFSTSNFSYSVLNNVTFNSRTPDGDLPSATDTGRGVQRAKIRGSLFQGCELTNVALEAVDVEGTSFARARFVECRVANMLAKDSDFFGAELIDVELGDGRFEGASFVEANLKGAKARGADFTDARLREVNLAGFEADSCVFNGAVLVSAKLDNSVFWNCDFIGSDLTGARCLAQSHEDRAFFVAVNLRAANLAGAILWFVDFNDCDFQAASLSNSDVRGARFTDPIFTAGILTNILAGGGAQMGDFDKPSASFSGNSKFGNADLKAANLNGCKFEDVNFEHAILDGASFRDVRWTGSTSFKGAAMRGVLDFFPADVSSGGLWTGHPADFQYAIIEATEAPSLNSDPRWPLFKNWLERPGPLSVQDKTADNDVIRRKLNWVAWKNNYASIGLYDEQGECYRQERLQAMGRPGKRILVHTDGDLAALGWFSVFSLVFISGFLGVLVSFATVATWAEKLLGLGGSTLYQDVPPCVSLVGCVLMFGGCGLVAMVFKEPYRTRFWDSLFGFGERPVRVLFNAGLVVTIFALLYFGLNSGSSILHLGWLEFDNPVPNFWTEYLYFSTVTFTTLGHYSYKAYLIVTALVALESAVGLIFAALLIQTLARRIGGR